MNFQKNIWARRVNATTDLDVVYEGDLIRGLATVERLITFETRYDPVIDSVDLDDFTVAMNYDNKDFHLLRTEISESSDRVMRLTFQKVNLEDL